MILKDYFPDKSWSLFLDRDGVINERIIDGYVLSWDEFRFLPGVKEALTLLSSVFGHIFIVTNQQGIGKGLMSEKDLEAIHEKMLQDISDAGGNITKVYYSPFLSAENHISRKPNPGMAIMARREYPVIDLTKSFMVGDSKSDMEFGRNAGMVNVFIGKKEEIEDETQAYCYSSLEEFANQLTAR